MLVDVKIDGSGWFVVVKKKPRAGKIPLVASVN